MSLLLILVILLLLFGGVGYGMANDLVWLIVFVIVVAALLGYFGR